MIFNIKDMKDNLVSGMSNGFKNGGVSSSITNVMAGYIATVADTTTAVIGIIVFCISSLASVYQKINNVRHNGRIDDITADRAEFELMKDRNEYERQLKKESDK